MSEPTYRVEEAVKRQAEILTAAVEAIESVGNTVTLLATENEKQWRALAELRDDVHTLASQLPVDAILSVLPVDPHEVQR